ncbi:hypothetical protein K0M31_016946 [Melipona bicolor]|uniref:Uncharacterized protein n=1 Tax=Melipona bicolor TaxID=60889 RepID=A0AA40FDV0_9HYME|nr:hypothetical protein K0M31_016946 [Melipona bicolor]
MKPFPSFECRTSRTNFLQYVQSTSDTIRNPFKNPQITIEGISTNRLDPLYGISFSVAELDTMDFLGGITRRPASIKCRFPGTLNTEARPHQGQVLSSSQSLERLASIQPVYHAYQISTRV